MKLLNWVKYGNTIKVIMLMKLLKEQKKEKKEKKLLKEYYTSFSYTLIDVSKQLSFILLSMFSNNIKIYFSFNNIDVSKKGIMIYMHGF